MRYAMIAGIAAVACCLPVPASAAPTGIKHTGPVSPVAASGTPALAVTTTTQRVRQLVQCGGTMYAVGQFTKITQGGATYRRNNIFSFSATAPFKITSWVPNVNGTVNSIALTSHCSRAYIGGNFTRVHGAPAHNIAEISTRTGAIVPTWPHSANGWVGTLVLTPNRHLLAGGVFTSINGSSAHHYYTSLNPATGKDDGYLNLHVSGHYVYPGVASNGTAVANQQLSPGGGHVLVEGTFTSVESQPRQQIFMLSLGRHGTVSGWHSTEFNQHCAHGHPFYVHAAAFSPDGSTVYVADTGFHVNTWRPGTYPLTGLCDAVAAFPATQAGGLHHKWVNYTGCDSLYSVAADASAVYVGGHERWADNSHGCNFAGRGAIPAPGLGGFTHNGALLKNRSGTAGRYSRARGLGADDMLLTRAGLWIASDTFAGSRRCGAARRAGICFLPYG